MAQSFDNPAFQSDAGDDSPAPLGLEAGSNHLTELNLTNGEVDLTSYETGHDDKTASTDIITADVESTERVPLWSRGRSLLYRRRGLLLATGAALFFSAENMLMDVLASALSIFEVGAIMSSFEILLTLVCTLIARKQFPKGKLQYFSLLISGLCLAVGLPLALESLNHMEVGDSITIIYTMPIFSGIFSWIILREPLRIVDFLFALLSFGGVVLIARPPFIFGSDSDMPDDNNPLLGAVYALASAVSFALLVVIARKQSGMGLHPIVILLFNVIVVFVLNATVCTALDRWTLPRIAEWGYLVGLACSDLIAQTLIYAAVVVEVAMFVSIISTSEVIFTFLWQFIFLSIVPDWISAIGAVLILASCIGLATKREKTPNDGDGTDNDKTERPNQNTIPSVSEVVDSS